MSQTDIPVVYQLIIDELKRINQSLIALTEAIHPKPKKR